MNEECDQIVEEAFKDEEAKAQALVDILFYETSKTSTENNLW